VPADGGCDAQRSSKPAGRADARQVEAACRPVRVTAGLGRARFTRPSLRHYVPLV
jgi:hypothetical protein